MKPFSMFLSAFDARFLYLLVLSFFLASCASGNSGGGNKTTQGQSYSTTFPATENPISENGKWVNGVTGNDNVQMTPNFAFGNPPSGQFTDSIAVLAGNWAPNQTAQATVRITTPNSACCHEVELHLHMKTSGNNWTGYEINCSVAADMPYTQIVRWDVGNFMILDPTSSVGCADGDVLKASIQGNTITVQKNGQTILTNTESTYPTGNPGIGFYETDSNVSYFGFSSFTASDSQ